MHDDFEDINSMLVGFLPVIVSPSGEPDIVVSSLVW